MTKALDLILRLKPDTEVIGMLGGNEKDTAIKLIPSVLKQQFKPWDKLVVDLEKVKITPRIVIMSSAMAEPVTIGGNPKSILSFQRKLESILTSDSGLGSSPYRICDLARMTIINKVPKYGWVVFNGDSPEIRETIKKTKSPALKVSYGFNPQNDVVISQPKEGEIAVALNTGIKHVFSFLPTTKTNPMDIAPSIVIGLLEGLDFDKIQRGLT